jgi:hypothetical protein
VALLIFAIISYLATSFCFKKKKRHNTDLNKSPVIIKFDDPAVIGVDINKID